MIIHSIRACSTQSIALPIYTPAITSFYYILFHPVTHPAHLHSSNHFILLYIVPASHSPCLFTLQQSLHFIIYCSTQSLPLPVYTPAITSFYYILFHPVTPPAHLHSSNHFILLYIVPHSHSPCPFTLQQSLHFIIYCSTQSLTLPIYTPAITSFYYILFHPVTPPAHLHSSNHFILLYIVPPSHSPCPFTLQQSLHFIIYCSTQSLPLPIYTPAITSFYYILFHPVTHPAHLHSSNHFILLYIVPPSHSPCPFTLQQSLHFIIYCSTQSLTLPIYTPAITSFYYILFHPVTHPAHLHSSNHFILLYIVPASHSPCLFTLQQSLHSIRTCSYQSILLIIYTLVISYSIRTCFTRSHSLLVNTPVITSFY